MNHTLVKLMMIAVSSACSIARAQDSRDGQLSASSNTWDRPTATGATITGTCTASANDSVNDDVAYEVFYIRTGPFSPTLDIRVDSLEPTPLDLDPFIAVYCDSFDPNLPSTNLLEIDDDSGGYPNAHAAFPFIGLAPNSLYIAVVSSYSNYPQSQYGNFRISIGPNLFFSTACPPDLNGDGDLDFLDISLFINAYTNGLPEADFNFDNSVDFLDISYFLNVLNNGCP